ncbi:MAG: NAD-dependent deacylase [Elusimicrobiaceae bacterium]|nr:NAD-dependent deacylase [Elusimicrobiaceae bacterium]
MSDFTEAVKLIKNATAGVVFTGAGISVESGIAPFTGTGGLWNQYDPKYIEINFFTMHPQESWREMKKIFFNDMHDATPNKAHEVAASLEKRGNFKGVITQNIDGLHQKAGSKNVQEFHGTIYTLSCVRCGKQYKLADIDLSQDPPCCSCSGVLKPNFVFYGEGIPPAAYQNSLTLAQNCDVMLIVGTAGQVMPACSMPLVAKEYGAKIIEVNPQPSSFTNSITDYYFPQKATEFFATLEKEL